jgi:hypothetical protein
MNAYKACGGLVFAIAIFSASDAAAQCTKDVDCKGDRVCVEGACAAPAPVVAPATAPQPQVVVVDPKRVPPKTKRQSTGLFVLGIVSLSLTPIALSVAGFGALLKSACSYDTQSNCNSRFDGMIYGGLVTSLILAGGGLGMLLYGAERVPVDPPPEQPAMKVVPWATASAGGVAWQLAY